MGSWHDLKSRSWLDDRSFCFCCLYPLYTARVFPCLHFLIGWQVSLPLLSFQLLGYFLLLYSLASLFLDLSMISIPRSLFFPLSCQIPWSFPSLCMPTLSPIEYCPFQISARIMIFHYSLNSLLYYLSCLHKGIVSLHIQSTIEVCHHTPSVASYSKSEYRI